MSWLVLIVVAMPEELVICLGVLVSVPELPVILKLNPIALDDVIS
jgi:hypothetical protein